MTAGEIESIISKHEMQRIELKESFDAECIETACAFANAHGGLIFIGVTDCGEPSKSQLRRESLRDYEKKLDLVMSETEITRAAYLLFAKDPQRGFSQAVIHAGAFKADGAVIYDTLDVQGNIQDQIERTLEFVQKNIRCAIVVTGKAAHDRYWEYPLEAIRETLANAICHRDYSLPFKIEVKVFENRVVVSSPGPLPFGISLEDLDKVDCPSRPRNKLIAQVLYDMHVIENYGSGFRRIREECDKNGNPYPVCEEHATEFRVTYPTRTVESVAKLGLEPYHFGLEKTNKTPTRPEPDRNPTRNLEQSGSFMRFGV